MDRGYVRLWRKTLDSGLVQHPRALQLFVHLLLTATSRPCRRIVAGGPVDLQPGDVITGRERLAQELGASVREIRTALDILKKMGIVTSRATNKYSIVSIVNWNTYQQERPAERPAAQPAERPASDQQATTEQEGNNINRVTPVSNDTSVTLAQKSTSNRPKGDFLMGKRRRIEGRRKAAFEQFWEAFGYKKGKAEAIDAWAAIPELTNALMEQILEAAKREAARRPELIAQGKTPIYPQGWITGRRWEDEELEAEGPWQRPEWMDNPDYDWDEHERRHSVQHSA